MLDQGPILRRRWTREELILALELYMQLPFGKMHHSNPEVISLAVLINRTPGSIAMRLGNFAACDPHLQVRGIKGLEGGIDICRPIWDEFHEDTDDLVYEAESIRNKLRPDPAITGIFSGTDKSTESLAIVKQRLHQQVFRKAILANYNSKCAVCGIDTPELLIASHIVPWAVDSRIRLNPENGICLSALYDKAYDQGLITIDTDYRIIIGSQLKSNFVSRYYQRFFGDFANQKIALPELYPPDRDFLQYHMDNVYVG